MNRYDPNIYTPVRSIIPLTDSAINLGSATKKFANLYSVDGYFSDALTVNGDTNLDYTIVNDNMKILGPDGFNATGEKACIFFGGVVSPTVGYTGIMAKYGTGLILGTYKASGGGNLGPDSVDAIIINDFTGDVSVNSHILPITDSTSDLGSALKYLNNAYANHFIVKGGTSAQFLKGDGSLDSSVYALNSALANYLPLAGGTMLGTINSLSVIPTVDSASDLGSSAKYFRAGYLDKIWLNSTATLDGATAGLINATGNLDVSGHGAFGENASVSSGVVLEVNTLNKKDTYSALNVNLANEAMGGQSMIAFGLAAQVNAGPSSFTLLSALTTGAVSATLATPWLKATSTYNVIFSNGDVRVCTFTLGSTAITWTGGLSGNATTSIFVEKNFIASVLAIDGYTIVGGTNWGNSLSYVENLALSYGFYSGTLNRGGSRYRKNIGLYTYAEYGYIASIEDYSVVGVKSAPVKNTLWNDFIIWGHATSLWAYQGESPQGSTYQAGYVRQFSAYIDKPTYSQNPYQLMLQGSGEGSGIFFNGLAQDVAQGSLSRIFHNGTNLKVCGDIDFGKCTRSAITYTGALSALKIDISDTQMFTGSVKVDYKVEVQTVISKAITAVSKQNGNVINITCTGHGLSANQSVEILGMSDSRYDGWYIVLGAGLTLDNFRVQKDFYGTATGTARRLTYRWSDDGGATWDVSDIESRFGFIDFNNGIKVGWLTTALVAVGDTASWSYTPAHYLRVSSTGIDTSVLAAQDLKLTCGAGKTLELQNVVYDDINTGLTTGKIPAANYPDWNAMIGNIYEYQFKVDDYIDVAPLELLHNWKEGTEIELHIHWATGGLNNATVRGVKWKIEYSWANMQNAGGTVVFATGGTPSVETSIAANEAALTHKYTSVVSFTPTGGKIGAYLCMRITRIASVTNTAPVANPFGLAVGIHYQIDTLGSRNQGAK